MPVSSKEILRKVKEDFINRRGMVYEECERKKLALYEEIPQLREFDAQLAATSTKIMAAVTSGGDVKAKIEELRK